MYTPCIYIYIYSIRYPKQDTPLVLFKFVPLPCGELRIWAWATATPRVFIRSPNQHPYPDSAAASSVLVAAGEVRGGCGRRGWRTARTRLRRASMGRTRRTSSRRLCDQKSTRASTGRSSASGSPRRRWSTRPWSSVVPAAPTEGPASPLRSSASRSRCCRSSQTRTSSSSSSRTRTTSSIPVPFIYF
jgi:hypothetical protein